MSVAEAHPWAPLVKERGGVPLASLEEAAGLDPSDGPFVAVLCHDGGLLPAVARLTPEQAAAFLIVLGEPAPPGAGAAANRLRQALLSGPAEAILLKAGAVGAENGGPSLPVEEPDVTTMLDAIVSGAVVWERDPDFGYELAAEVPGLGSDRAGLLVPRFFYARTDRVYEHAALVPRRREERRRLLAAIEGLAPEIVAAVG